MNPEPKVYQVVQVNKIAQKERHGKVFSRLYAIKQFFVTAFEGVKFPVKFIKSLNIDLNILPVAPNKRFFSQMIIFSIMMFVVSGISPISNFATMSVEYSTDYIDTYSLPGDILITDSDGYLMKINPQTGSSSRIGLTDYALHTVESGETLSQIAKRYSLGVETIMWENNIGNANTIILGQKLVIPPVDGISYTAKKGDSLDGLSKKYNITLEAILAQNGLTDNTLTIGQSLFLPGAKPIIQVAQAPYAVKSSSGSTTNLSNSDDVPIGSKPFIYPTRGNITQGYRAGHYAIDIADRSMPPVWAAGTGTVIKAYSGGWGGGYGNHVIIDHGNGLQTLYAHLDHLSVSEGDYVEQGQAIGQMGNTGRVYGATGIHLHWEVIKNGVKQYPGNYY